MSDPNLNYPGSSFETFFHSESGSFWFRSRQRIIEFLVKKYMPSLAASFLEVGCGTGFVLQGLSRSTPLRLTGAELHLEGLKWAKKRLPRVELIQMDVTHMSFQQAFEGLGAFDVIEHIDDDRLALKNMCVTLKT